MTILTYLNTMIQAAAGVAGIVLAVQQIRQSSFSGRQNDKARSKSDDNRE